MKKFLLLLALFGFAFAQNKNDLRAKEAPNALLKACEQGYIEACLDAGVYYAAGMSIKQNVQKALEYYSKACDKSDKIACFNMAGLYLNINNNENIKRDLSKAKEFYNKACELGDVGRCYFLWLLERENGEIKNALEFQAKACDGIEAHAYWVLGENINSTCSLDDESECNKMLGFCEKVCVLGSQLGCKYAMSIESGMPWLRY